MNPNPLLSPVIRWTIVCAERIVPNRRNRRYRSLLVKRKKSEHTDTDHNSM